MGFWAFILIMNLLLPFTMIGFGKYFVKKAPEEMTMKLKQDMIGTRIRLRNYKKADLSFCTGMWLDEVNGKYLSDPTSEHADEIYQKALDTLEDSKYGYYLIAELLNTKEKIGTACIFPDEKNRYDIGYCIHKTKWKQGYGSEVISLLLSWLQEQGADEVTGEVAADNIASNKLLQKSGFHITKETRFKKYNMDITFDSYIYSRNLSLL